MARLGKHPPSVAAGAPPLTTEAERSLFQRTGRYEEVIELCQRYSTRWPKEVRCIEFGRTPEDRPMLALVASRTHALSPEAAHARGLEVILVQAGIHAGEIDGKDGGFIALRTLLEDRSPGNPLDSVVFVFVPVVNVDGHERFGRWNRPNQNGPDEMGWRTTAQNLNLNRQYTTADAPEMRAMLRLLNTWDPILYVDLHTTDGAQFQYDSALLVEPSHIGDPDLQSAGRSLQDALLKGVTQSGHLPLKFYPNLADPNDPGSGFQESVFPARVSISYWALRNRIGVLVETHSWKDYGTRVQVMTDAVHELAQLAASYGRAWRGLALAADDRARRLGGTQVPLDFRVGEHATTIDFRGYRYVCETSELSGGQALRYDATQPELWRVPFRDTVMPATIANVPGAGYIVPAAYVSWITERLSVHDIEYSWLKYDFDKARVDSFRASHVVFASKPNEGRWPVSFEGSWRADLRDIPRGSIFVPIAQPKSRLVLTLLEPQSSDSYASWGFFNGVLEVKEYVENYVAETIAVEMMANDKLLASEFRKRLSEEPAFAASPQARLAFFTSRHRSADDRLNLYPIYRVDIAPDCASRTSES
jgi:Zinc carboxypeptidase